MAIDSPHVEGETGGSIGLAKIVSEIAGSLDHVVFVVQSA
jgi:hypothetical protein